MPILGIETPCTAGKIQIKRLVLWPREFLNMVSTTIDMRRTPHSKVGSLTIHWRRLANCPQCIVRLYSVMNNMASLVRHWAWAGRGMVNFSVGCGFWSGTVVHNQAIMPKFRTAHQFGGNRGRRKKQLKKCRHLRTIQHSKLGKFRTVLDCFVCVC